MKRICSIFLMLVISLGMSAQCRLSASTPVDVNGDWVVEVSMDNPHDIVTSVQFDLTVPSDFSYTMGNYVLTSRCMTTKAGKDVDTHNVVSNEVTNGGIIRIIVYSNDNVAMKGTNGAFIKVLLSGAGTAKATPCNLTNIVITTLIDGEVNTEAVYSQAVVSDESLSCYDCMDDDAFVIGALTEKQKEEVNVNFATAPSLNLVDLTKCTNETLGELSVKNPQAIIVCDNKSQVSNADNVFYKDGTMYKCESFKLYDGAAAVVLPVDAMVAKATYYRTFSNTEWQALYLPLEIPVEPLVEDYDLAQLDAITEDDENIYVKVKRVYEGTLSPNVPYFIKSHEEGDVAMEWNNVKAVSSMETTSVLKTSVSDFVFTGNYSTNTSIFESGAYAMSGGTLKQASSADVALGTFRWYMIINTISGAKKRIVMDVDDDVTGVSSSVCESAESCIYDLTGRRVANAKKGVYVVKGKKIVKK